MIFGNYVIQHIYYNTVSLAIFLQAALCVNHLVSEALITLSAIMALLTTIIHFTYFTDVCTSQSIIKILPGIKAFILALIMKAMVFAKLDCSAMWFPSDLFSRDLSSPEFPSTFKFHSELTSLLHQKSDFLYYRLMQLCFHFGPCEPLPFSSLKWIHKRLR